MGRRSAHRLRAVGTGVAEAVPRYDRLRVEQRLMAHCVTAYHATRPFMTMKTPATTRTTATPTLSSSASQASRCELGCDDMGIAEFAIARRSVRTYRRSGRPPRPPTNGLRLLAARIVTAIDRN
jgi:hypothetical protein